MPYPVAAVRGKGSAAVETYAGYLQTLVNSGSLLHWQRQREASGTAIANSGSLGSATNGTISGTFSLNQVGALGAGEAVTFGGSNTLITVPTNASLVALTTFTYAFLFNPASAGGGGGNGRFFRWGGNNYLLSFNGALTVLRALAQGTGSADTITTTGLASGAFAWLFMTFDNAGDRKIRLHKGVSGAVTEFAYGTQTAMTGTFTAPTGLALSVGNRNSADQGLDGKLDEVLIFNKVLTADEMNKIVLLSAA